MRVISGKARGTKLDTLDTLSTRPTLDRIKESLFNILYSKIPEAIVLDLFAGSGALGIECASRGAKKIYFCDKSKQAIRIIKKNVEKTNIQDKSVVMQDDYKTALRKIKEKIDLVFLDPPYDTNLAIEATEEIIHLNMINDDGIIILETDNDQKIIESLEKLELGINIYDIRKYGRVKLIFINRKG